MTAQQRDAKILYAAAGNWSVKFLHFSETQQKNMPRRLSRKEPAEQHNKKILYKRHYVPFQTSSCSWHVNDVSGGSQLLNKHRLSSHPGVLPREKSDRKIQWHLRDPHFKFIVEWIAVGRNLRNFTAEIAGNYLHSLWNFPWTFKTSSIPS